MSWLVVERILPSFDEGPPPVNLRTDSGVPTAWQVSWGGEVVGKAASIQLPGIAGTKEIHNRVVLENVPIMEMAPAWMRHLIGNLGRMTFDVRTRIEFDSLGHFSAFTSRIVLNELPSVLRITGKLEDSYLELRMRSGDISYPARVYMPNSSYLNEALFPSTHLANISVGRKWREEFYSPFSSPGDPIQVVQAEVVGSERLEYYGNHYEVMRVEYLAISNTGLPSHARKQAVSWVTLEGVVLQRDVTIGNSRLRFVRLPDDTATEISNEFFSRQLLEAQIISTIENQSND